MDEMSNIVDKMNYYALLIELDQEEIKICKIDIVGAGLGSGFNHTSKLHVIKYNEAIKWTQLWSLEMMSWEQTWANDKNITCQEKSSSKGHKNLRLGMVHEKNADGTLQGRLTAHGCSQNDEEHYNSYLIDAPVKNDWAICIMLAFMLMANEETYAIDVSGAFMHKDFKMAKWFIWEYLKDSKFLEDLLKAH